MLLGLSLLLVAALEWLRLPAALLLGPMLAGIVIASLVARLWIAAPAAAAPAVVWLPAIAWGPFAATLAVVALGVFVAPRLRVPAGPMLLPLAAGTLLQDSGLLTIELPPWLLAM